MLIEVMRAGEKGKIMFETVSKQRKSHDRGAGNRLAYLPRVTLPWVRQAPS